MNALRVDDNETLYNLALDGKIEVSNIPSHSVNNESLRGPSRIPVKPELERLMVKF